MSPTDLASLVAEALAPALASARMAIPATVLSYDAAEKTAKCQPVVKRPIQDEAGRIVFEEWAVVDNVPVAFPGGAGLDVSWPLEPGDAVDLIFQDLSFAVWLSTGRVGEAFDTRAHGPASPIAVPWMRPGGGPGPDSDKSIGIPGGLRIHFADAAVSVGSGTDFVAKATPTEARLVALEGAVTAVAAFCVSMAAAFAAHVHPVPGITPGGGATTSSPSPTAPPTAPSAPSAGATVASSNLKVD